jgi:hypothetical protein
MCTILRCTGVGDWCFCETQDDFSSGCACLYESNRKVYCSDNKQLDSEHDPEPFVVSIPSVVNLRCRTAYLCGSCGLNWASASNPVGCGSEVDHWCCAHSGGCNLLTARVRKRGCRLSAGECLCCACEPRERPDPERGATCCDVSSSGMLCCCLVGGQRCALTCCPADWELLGTTYQCCCLFGRCAFPTTALVPCELGVAGFFCIDRSDSIDAIEIDRAARARPASVTTLRVPVPRSPPARFRGGGEYGGSRGGGHGGGRHSSGEGFGRGPTLKESRPADRHDGLPPPRRRSGAASFADAPGGAPFPLPSGKGGGPRATSFNRAVARGTSLDRPGPL